MEKNKVSLQKEELLKALVIASRFVPLRPSIPVLANVLIKAEKGNLIISATNLENSAKIIIPAKSNEEWEITIPAKIATEFVSNANGKEISIEKEKESIKILGEEVSGSLTGISASEFPKLPEEKDSKVIELKQKTIQEAINQVAFAATTDESKPILTGILIRSEEGKTSAVATDGYRLAKKELEGNFEISEILIGARSLVEVLKIAGEMGEDNVKLSVSKEENQTIFSGDNFQISGRLLDGVYPNYKQIIPQKFVTTVKTNREQLIAGIKAAAVFARDIGNVIKLNIEENKEVKITANTLQVGEGESRVAGEVKGETLKVAINSHYLLEGLNCLKSEIVELSFSGVLSPTLLRDPADKSFFYIVMPVKAQN